MAILATSIRWLCGRRLTRRTIAIAYLLLAFPLGSCSEPPVSMLAPKGPTAARIADLWWLMFYLGTAIYIAVLAILFYALYRSRRSEPEGAMDHPNRGISLVIVGGIVVPVLVLSVLVGFNFATMAAIQGDEASETITIEVVGHQWWWEIYYPEPGFETANELHIPVGEQVRIRLTSADVIHSFWVPELTGKLDLIPGDFNSFLIAADEEGVYYGECAEFCGAQHAQMKFLVVAEPAEEYAEWLAQQQQPAQAPADPFAARGQEIFLRSGCVSCHTVEGTQASGDIGPDLTHLASRRTIGAGILENTRGHLGGWIIDPQELKPGNLMPPVDLTGEELQALLAYLTSLE